MNLSIRNTNAEFLKIRRTNAVWLTLAGAAFIPSVNFLKLVSRPDVFVSRTKADPWAFMISDNWAPAGSLFLPIYVILMISLVVQIENTNNTWKQVYASPRSYADIYFSKFFVVLSLIVLWIVLLSLFIIISGYILETANKDYVVSGRPIPWKQLSTIAVKMFAAVVGITSIQYWMSLRFKNFVTPIGIGMALLTAALLIRQWEYISYYPYAQSLLVYFPNPGLEKETADKAILNSVAECIIVLSLGFYHMCIRKEKG